MTKEMSHLEFTAQTILDIQWEHDYNKTDLYIKLCKECVRRGVVRATARGEEYLSMRVPLYMDLFNEHRLDPDTGYCETVLNHLAKNSWGGLNMRNFIFFALNWAYWEDMDLLPDKALPNPYAPIIVAYREGIYLMKSNVIGWEVSVGSGFVIPRDTFPTYATKPPFIDIDDRTYTIRAENT